MPDYTSKKRSDPLPEFALAAFNHLTFLGVDLEFQVLRDEAGNAVKDALASPWAFDHNNQVIRGIALSIVASLYPASVCRVRSSACHG